MRGAIRRPSAHTGEPMAIFTKSHSPHKGEVPEAGLEPARAHAQRIFILHYVTIAAFAL